MENFILAQTISFKNTKFGAGNPLF